MSLLLGRTWSGAAHPNGASKPAGGCTSAAGAPASSCGPSLEGPMRLEPPSHVGGVPVSGRPSTFCLGGGVLVGSAFR